MITRRKFFVCTAGLIGAGATLRGFAGHKRMGLVVHSYWKRWQGKHSSIKYPPFVTALDVLDHCRELGVGGLQIGVDGWTSDFAGKVRDTRESYDLYIEGSLTLPRSEGDVARFDKMIRTGKEAGARVFRSAIGGRRYEVFSRLEDFKAFKDAARRSMQLAAPIAHRHGVKIGIENHKDFQAAELADLLAKLASENIGACIDTGNSIALLEDPMTTVSTLAPFVVTTHVKDMAVQPADEGFLLSEVPLGEGILDLPRVFQTIAKALPSVTFNLEMITRDPLRIPCLTEKYWATFPDKRGSELAAMLDTVRKRAAARLPSVSDKTTDAALAYEEENILKSLRYGGEKLGLPYLPSKNHSKTNMKSNPALLTLVLVASLAHAGDWPHWRGANFDGISTEPINTTGVPKTLWKAQTGIGFSSFSVAAGRVFTMGHEDGKDTIWCFDAATGKNVWSHSYDSDLGDKYFEGGTTGTPTVDGDRVFALSRWGDVFCLDAATGKIVWTRNVRQDYDLRIPDWGFSGSPLVSGGTLVLNMAESGVALDKGTGKTLWQSRNKDAGYSTPYPFLVGGKKSAILGSGRAYLAVEIATGSVLWSIDWRTSYGVNAADPIVRGGEMFISSGYEKGCALFKLGGTPPAVVWTNKNMRNQMSPSILIGGHIYGIDGNESKDPMLKCLDWATGAEKWKFPAAGAGTVAAAGDQLIVLSDKGEICIGKASPDGFKPTVRAQVLTGRCWTVPVLSHGRLYCRNAAGDVVCLDVRPR